MAACMNSGVGFDNIVGKSVYDISGNIVISPEYFWLRTETAFVRVLGKMPSSDSICIRCSASPLAKWVMLSNQVGPDPTVGVDCCAS